MKLTTDDLISKRIASELRRTMREKHITVTQVAEKLDVGVTAISKTVNGKTAAINLERCEKIANAIGISKEEFDSLVSEAQKYELGSSHGKDILEAIKMSPEIIDTAFMARHHIPEAKRVDLMRFLQVLQGNESHSCDFQ